MNFNFPENEELITIHPRPQMFLYELDRIHKTGFYKKFQDQIFRLNHNSQVRIPKRIHDDIAWVLADIKCSDHHREFIEHRDMLCAFTIFPVQFEKLVEWLKPWLKSASDIETLLELQDTNHSGDFDKLSVTSPLGEALNLSDKNLIKQLIKPKLEGKLNLIQLVIECFKPSWVKAISISNDIEPSEVDFNYTQTIEGMIGNPSDRRRMIVRMLAEYLKIFDLIDKDQNDRFNKKQFLSSISRILQSSGYLREDDFTSSIEQIIRNDLNRMEVSPFC